ncbi:hypothetical protein [Ruegeria atlantica]|uniref:hypothetical protein n=1 Tax=Ruegeria atlantica TaxID=81569 RepID=UPI0014812284|nr:hypothetical protein [Ruegeria atlantica]
MFFIICFILSGCTKIPDVSTQYYLTKSTLRLDVSRALTCSSGGQIEITDAVSPVIVNSADLGARREFDLQKLKSTFTDPSVTVKFYDDGRLQSINATQTGTAKQIIESSLSLVNTIGLTGTPKSALPGDIPPCDYIEKHGSKGILTLQYSESMNVPGAGKQVLKPVGVSKIYHNYLSRLIGEEFGSVHAHIDRSDLTRLSHPVEIGSEDKSDYLWARQLTKVRIRIHTDKKDEKIWNGSVLMALPGNDYKIPIPRRPAFGKQEFQVAFSESGSLSTLKYASESGTADAISITESTVGELQGPSAADQANALKAEADLIKQRERLAICRANPSECN